MTCRSFSCSPCTSLTTWIVDAGKRERGLEPRDPRERGFHVRKPRRERSQVHELDHPGPTISPFVGDCGLLAAMSNLTQSPAWRALATHKPTIEAIGMRELFERDPERFAKMSREACGIFVDYSKHRATERDAGAAPRPRQAARRRELARQDVRGREDQRHRRPRRPARRAAQPRQPTRSSSTART